MKIKVGDTVRYRGGDGLTAVVLVTEDRYDIDVVRVQWETGGITTEHAVNLEVVNKLKYEVGDKVSTSVGYNKRLTITDGVVVGTRETTSSPWVDYQYQVAPESDPSLIRWFYEFELTPREEPAKVELDVDAVVLKATEDIMFKIAFMENHPEEFTPIALTLYVSERLSGLAEELRKE